MQKMWKMYVNVRMWENVRKCKKCGNRCENIGKCQKTWENFGKYEKCENVEKVDSVGSLLRMDLKSSEKPLGSGGAPLQLRAADLEDQVFACFARFCASVARFCAIVARFRH